MAKKGSIFSGSTFSDIIRRYGIWFLIFLILIFAFVAFSQGNPPRLPTIQHNQTNFTPPGQINYTPPAPHATLVVIKHVINDDDGNLKASHFLIYVNGVNVSRTISGSEEGISVTLFPGEYAVSEKNSSKYSSGLSDDCSGTIAAGEVKTCIITNDDVPSPPEEEGAEEEPAKNKTILGGGGSGRP